MQIRLLTVFFIGFSLLTQAQKFTNSPFSAYGIGEFGGLDHATFSGMGNSSIALIDTTILNFYNPSSYASLGKGQPLFSTGISSRFSEFTEGSQSAKSKYIGVDHFAIGVPFAKYLGLAVGLKPFSRTGYNFYDTRTVGTDNMHYIYRGTGGTHEVFGGFSANVLNLKREKMIGKVKRISYHRIGLGANLGYVFGSTINERISYIDKNYAVTDAIPGGVENSGYTIKSIHADFGLNYTWIIDKGQSLTIGAVYTPTQHMTARKNYFLAYSADVNDSDQFDLLDTAINEKGRIVMPASYGAGFSYTMRPRKIEDKIKIFQLTFTGEFKMTNWSEYRASFSQVTTENYSNTMAVRAGIQFVPHYDYKDRAANISYLYRVRYRAGFQYATLPLVVDSKQQQNMGVTVGIGLPFAVQRASSSLNLGIVVGKQGNGNAPSINERYIGVNFGVTISPGLNDRWFRKFKID